MARGGKRAGAGRPAGGQNADTAASLQALAVLMDGHVKTAIAALADIAKNGTSDCNLYTVKTPNPIHPERGSPRTPFLKTPNPIHPAGDAPPHMDVINPAGDAPEPSLTIKNHQRTIIADDEFEAFWSVVPRKAGKGQAVTHDGPFDDTINITRVIIEAAVPDDLREALDTIGNRLSDQAQ